MKTKNRVYNRGPWCAISFPERNRTLLYNTATKKGEVWSDKVNRYSKEKKQLPKVDLIQLKDDWKRIAMWMAGGWVIWGLATIGLLLYKVI